MNYFLLCVMSFVTGLSAHIFAFRQTLYSFSVAENEYGSKDSCNPREGQQGQCIRITQCPAMLNVVQNEALTPEEIEKFQKSRCGFEGREPKVCCVLQNESGDRNAASITPVSAISDEQRKNLLPSTDMCGLPLPNFIAGDLPVGIGEFSWMALIEYEKPNGRGFNCQGTLINNRYVVTAAHCVRGRDLPSTWKIVSVRLGEHDINTETDCDLDPASNENCAKPPINVLVEEQIVHENYNPLDQNHNIALLRLAKEVSRTEFVQPVCLPTSEILLKKDFAGEVMEAVGWRNGETRTRNNIKLKSFVTVMSNLNCSKIKDNKVLLIAGKICVERRKKEDFCGGDNGSPLMSRVVEFGQFNYYLTGVLSSFSSSCDLKIPNVYTRVTEYVPWIISKLRP